MTLDELQVEAHDTAKSKGWWNNDAGDYRPTEKNLAECLALIHSEVSEALEEARVARFETLKRMVDGKPEGFAIELADILIRVGDLAEAMGIRLSESVATKMAFNKTRPHRHGGKKF